MLLFKISGLLVVFLVAASLGLLKSESLKLRCDRLEKIVKSLNRLCELVRIGGYEIDELISVCFDSNIINSEKGNFFICEEYLLKEDIGLLREFFNGFGVSDKEGEAKRIELFCTLLNAKYQDAQKTFLELGRLYRSVGIMSGIIICIFFM